MAKLYFKYGAMGSSKTAQALITKYNYEENDLKVWLIKPSADTRDGAEVLRSRIGLEAQVEVIPPETDIYARFLGSRVRRSDVIIVDETHKRTEQHLAIPVTSRYPEKSCCHPQDLPPSLSCVCATNPCLTHFTSHQLKF